MNCWVRNWKFMNKFVLGVIGVQEISMVHLIWVVVGFTTCAALIAVILKHNLHAYSKDAFRSIALRRMSNKCDKTWTAGCYAGRPNWGLRSHSYKLWQSRLYLLHRLNQKKASNKGKFFNAILGKGRSPLYDPNENWPHPPHLGALPICLLMLWKHPLFRVL